MSGLIGKKIRMTQIFSENGEQIPVTVIAAGPCYVVQVKTEKNDGYEAVQIGFEEKKAKHTTQPMAGHYKKANVKSQRYLREFDVFEGSELKVGDELNVDIFAEGDRVEIVGKSKGKGFQGTMKRHNFSGANKTHGQSDRWRAPGSLGQSSSPSRVFKGIRMSGRTGGDRVTLASVEIVRIDSERNLLFVKGPVPGSVNSLIEIKKQ